MFARYLLRLDDACPTMHENWEWIEQVLDEYKIRPIVAVIPDNQDKSMYCTQPRLNFWDIIRRWQQKGWCIALHGYQHRYTQIGGGLLMLSDKSEFTGLPLSAQQELIQKGLSVFKQEGIQPACWIAPSHSFDRNTLEALRTVSDIRLISDGIALHPFTKEAFQWIPQQLWRFRKMPIGTWTFCLHPNTMKQTDLDALRQFIAKEADSFVATDQIQKFSSLNKLDELFRFVFYYQLKRKKKNV